MVLALGAVLGGIGCFFCTLFTCCVFCPGANRQGCVCCGPVNNDATNLTGLYRIRQYHVEQVQVVDSYIVQYEQRAYQHYSWTQRLRARFGQKPVFHPVYLYTPPRQQPPPVLLLRV